MVLRSIKPRGQARVRDLLAQSRNESDFPVAYPATTDNKISSLFYH